MVKLFNGQIKEVYPHIQHDTNFRSDTIYYNLASFGNKLFHTG